MDDSFDRDAAYEDAIIYFAGISDELSSALSRIVASDLPVIAGTTYARAREVILDPRNFGITEPGPHRSLLFLVGAFATIHVVGGQTFTKMDRAEQLRRLAATVPLSSEAQRIAGTVTLGAMIAASSIDDFFGFFVPPTESFWIGSQPGDQAAEVARFWFQALMVYGGLDPFAAVSASQAILPLGTVFLVPVPLLEGANGELISHPWRD